MDSRNTQGRQKENRRVENNRMEFRGNNRLTSGERRRVEREDIRIKRRLEERGEGQNKESKNWEERNGQTRAEDLLTEKEQTVLFIIIETGLETLIPDFKKCSLGVMRCHTGLS